MLVSFSVSNFRSFSEEQTFSLVASGRLSGTHDDHTVPIPDSDKRVLRIGVIYGANGAGKSSLFKALQYLEHLAITSRKTSGTGRVPFKFSDIRNNPSSFDLQFICNQSLYRYGVIVDDKYIKEEWLLKITGQHEDVIFERVTRESGVVEIDAPGLKGDEKAALLAKIGGPENQTFLATVNATLKSSDLVGHLKYVLDWFKSRLNLTPPDGTIEPVGHMLANNTEFRSFASGFLRGSSTGVHELEVDKEEISEEQLERIIPKNLLPKIKQDLDENPGGIGIVQYPNGQELILERAESNKFYRLSVHATHAPEGAKEVSRLSFNEESDGTRRLLQLLPALHLSKNTAPVYFIDEIDRSMHPMLIWKFLQSFLTSCVGHFSQIIVTTHESNLLDLDLLRRDEIWFAEKGLNLGTNIYSLSDYKVRKDLEIRKHYLQGRFGAVPFLGRIDNIIEDQE